MLGMMWDEDEALETPGDKLKFLVLALSGQNMGIADGWDMTNTTPVQNLNRLEKLREAKKKVGGDTKKNILCTLLEHDQDTSFNI